METKEYKGIEYTKDFHSLTDNVVSVLADGKFPITDRERLDKFYKDLQCDRVLGIIEFPTIDIELEMWTRGGYDYDWDRMEVEPIFTLDDKVRVMWTCTDGEDTYLVLTLEDKYED